jgi:membrane protein YdbS with pleckstrin-like domain
MYKIISTDTHKIVLERESVKLATGCFVAIGLLFFLIGVGLNFFMTTWEMPFLLFRVLFPLFGLGAVFAGLYLPKQTQNTQPEQIIFDHDKGVVVVNMTKAGDERGYIRYDEITGFDIYVESRRSSGSGSSSGRTYYTYHVFLKKKDGGEWHLFKYNDRSDAEVQIAQLTAQIPLNKTFTISNANTKLTSKVERKEGLDKTIIHWQNKVSWGQPIFLVIFSIIFFSILSMFLSVDMGGMDAFFMIVIGFILIVFCIVMFTVVRKLIKDATTRYAVSVDRATLEYYEFSKSSGQMKNRKTLPLNTVHSINYTFAPSKQYQNAGLTILTKTEAEHSEEIKEKPLQALKDLFKGNNQPITLSINALNPVECLQLESWLQELILKKGNVTVQ